MNCTANGVLLVSEALLDYGEELCPPKLDMNHASQILTNGRQILVLS